MKLRAFRVREFRSVWDSGTVDVDDRITCLVGKNEAGKTALIQALYRTNPIVPDQAEFDETYDYPKREVEDYRFAVQSGTRKEAVVVESTYELEDEDLEEVTSVFGPKTVRGRSFTRSSHYGSPGSTFSLPVNEDAARRHLAASAAITNDLKGLLNGATDWDAFAAALDAAESTEAVTDLRVTVRKVRENGLAHYVFSSLIWPRAPKFLYFDEYYQMTGQANLNALIGREDARQLDSSDYPLLGLLHLARLNHRELVATKNTTELKNKLEGASNFLTSRIVKYWSQNHHIQMRFDVRDAKPEDPEGMRSGINVWGEIYDTVHLASTLLGTRSRGFVWFFSFLAWYEDIKRDKKNVILLLDEPGLSLHGRAQADLLRYFEAELSAHQLVYTTHSPFMIDPTQLARVRIVQDRGIDAKEPLPKEQDGTKVLTNVFDATEDSLFPLQGALGYEIQQTLFIGPNSLVVDGPADMLYLQAVSAQLEREGRTGLSALWVITPVGGSGKIPTFVALLAPQKGMNVATLLDIQDADRVMVEGLYKSKLLKKKQVATYGDFAQKLEADVEDMFERPFYVDLVNAEFAKQLRTPLTVSGLDPSQPRVLCSIHRWLKENPLASGTFGHYRPARYFSENVRDLWPRVSDATKNRFEAAFKHLNGLLK